MLRTARTTWRWSAVRLPASGMSPRSSARSSPSSLSHNKLGLPRPTQVAAIVANVGFVDAGERAPNGARLDLLTTGTQTAVEAGVSERGPGAQLQRRVAARPDPGRTRQEPGHTDHRGLPAGAARRVDGHLRDRAHVRLHRAGGGQARRLRAPGAADGRRRLSAFGPPKAKRSRTPCGPEALLLAKTAGQTDIRGGFEPLLRHLVELRFLGAVSFRSRRRRGRCPARRGRERAP